MTPPIVLAGLAVRLEPLTFTHAAGLLAAFANASAELYRYAGVPRTSSAVEEFIARATAAAQAGTEVPFATIKVDGEHGNDRVVGTTRFYGIESWPWPDGHEWHHRRTPDVCKIGYTYLAPDAVRTGINIEAKLLMLTHAFETWHVHRVSWRADVRNERSRRAIETLGATFEGVLQADKIGSDRTVRDSACYSMRLAEWPARKERLIERLRRPNAIA